MIISYPVLPARQVNENEDAYFQRLLNTHVLPGEGRFPVSTTNTTKGPLNRWHGGVHIAGLGEPIRAIADGTVVAFRFAKSAETYEGLGEYDTSFVLLRHESQTGEHTTVVFYSLYMHLANRDALQADRYQQLPAWLRSPACTPGTGVQKPANLQIWRKDVLGFAGQLYETEACHVEVFVTDAQLQAFWRDSSVLTSGNGSDDFFGDAHFIVPAQQAFVAKHPRAAATGAHRIDFPGNQDFNLDVGQAGQNDRRLFVTVQLEKGDRIATTFAAKSDGSGYEQVGEPVVQREYEYELYRLSTALYPDCPSAGFEWLRFGRVLGADTTSRNENWQLVRYSATAIGYIDLAPQGIVKLSDADFPFWQGWEKCEEGQTASAEDGICDDQRTLGTVNGLDAWSIAKTRHLVCKAPSEWDASDLAVRYARLREPGAPLESDKAWQDFEAHVKKMAFWSDAGLGGRSVWHFHPFQFSRHFRKSSWLTRSELIQLLPTKSLRKDGTSWVYESVPIFGASGLLAENDTEAAGRRYCLNTANRKYLIVGSARLACFFGNATQETQWYQKFQENSPYWYKPWDGRGFLQLTHAANYIKYWDFRGLDTAESVRASLAQHTALANQSRGNGMYDAANHLSDVAAGIPPEIVARRNLVGSDASHRAESAGVYWVWSQASKMADQYWGDQTNNLVSKATSNAGTQYYYENLPFGKVAATVNIGHPSNSFGSIWGVQARFMAFANAQVILMDSARFPQPQSAVATALPANFSFRRPD